MAGRATDLIGLVGLVSLRVGIMVMPVLVLQRFALFRSRVMVPGFAEQHGRRGDALDGNRQHQQT